MTNRYTVSEMAVINRYLEEEKAKKELTEKQKQEDYELSYRRKRLVELRKTKALFEQEKDKPFELKDIIVGEIESAGYYTYRYFYELSEYLDYIGFDKLFFDVVVTVSGFQGEKELERLEEEFANE